MLQFYDFALIGIAAILAGAVNALAGGGTLITFPTLTAIGIPVVMANITNTIALLPVEPDDCLELDEMWSFVLKKVNKRWLWIALCRRTRQVLSTTIRK